MACKKMVKIKLIKYLYVMYVLMFKRVHNILGLHITHPIAIC